MERPPRFTGRTASSASSADIKRRTPRSNTAPERLLRSALWRLGFRYRLHSRHLPGRPDIVFAPQRVAIFCDGDFWHGRDWPSRRAKLARGANGEYWIAKIESNIRRDSATTVQLKTLGWYVIRVWESEIRQQLDVVVERICTQLDAAQREGWKRE